MLMVLAREYYYDEEPVMALALLAKSLHTHLGGKTKVEEAQAPNQQQGYEVSFL